MCTEGSFDLLSVYYLRGQSIPSVCAERSSAIPVFQRLGYILEHVLERADLAETLYSKMEVAGLKFRKIPFKINKPTEGCEVDKKWKVIINQEIEIDE